METPLRTQLTPARLAVMAVALALVAAHLLEPSGVLGDATYLAAIGGAAAMAWVGALRSPRGPSRIPVLIAAGITANAVGELIWILYVQAGYEPNVSVADVAYFLAYVGLTAALVLGMQIRVGAGARVDPDSIIDTLTIIVVSVLVFWHLSIAAIVADTTISGFTRFVQASYPVLDAILLAMVIRALMARRTRSTVGLAFAAGVVCWLVSDIGYLLTASTAVGAFLDAGWMLGAILLTTAAWRRPGTAAAPVADDAAPAHPLRKLGIATTPFLVPLVLHFGDDLRGIDGHIAATMISVALLLGLSFVRSARLLQSESRARTEARASRDAALAASEAKSAFLATMSHEIRTPMNAVIGMTDLLLDTQLDEQQHDFLSTVRSSGDALLAVIDDILDFSKIESGELRLTPGPFRLREEIENALDFVTSNHTVVSIPEFGLTAPQNQSEHDANRELPRAFVNVQRD